MRFLIIFIFLINNSFANEFPNIKNLVINKELKKYNDLSILDIEKNQINLEDYHGNIVLINFWATWCAQCKEEMPSLDLLSFNKKLKNLKIFPVNIGQDSVKKSEKFYKDLKIKNLQLYFDTPVTLAKKLSLRGIPTSILLNKEGEEFARIIGTIDFNNERFIKWLIHYD